MIQGALIGNLEKAAVVRARGLPVLAEFKPGKEKNPTREGWN